MAMETGSNNSRALQQAAAIQQETRRALQRIQEQTAETESIGITTLEELQLHREKLDSILKEGDRLHSHLDKAERLQNRFGRWTLNFNNRRVAVRDTRKSLERQAAKTKAEAERSLRISASSLSMGSTSASSSNGSSISLGSSSPLRVKHTSSLVKSRPKKNRGQPSTCDNGPKDLLYGIHAKGHENEDELRELADADRVIDNELEKVSSQIEGLLDMSRTMSYELKTQSAALDEVEGSLAKADYKTRVVNERGRRFLTGKPRRELDRSRALQLPC
jgi:archaellum component FlaC